MGHVCLLGSAWEKTRRLLWRAVYCVSEEEGAAHASRAGAWALALQPGAASEAPEPESAPAQVMGQSWAALFAPSHLKLSL